MRNSSEKKILYIDRPLEPPGGGQNSLLLMLQYLDKAKYESLVFMPFESEFANWLKEKNIAFQIVPPRSLYFAIKQVNSSIIHCNSAATRYTFWVALISKFLKLPFIWHVRVAESGGWRDKVIAFFSTKIIVVSDAVKGKFSWINNKDKVVKIYNAVETKIFQSGLNASSLYEEFGIEKEKSIVGIFSRIEPWKGHILFLDSAKIIKDKVKNVKFLVVGEGEKKFKKQLMGYVTKLGLNDDVVFTGFRRDIPHLMNLCDVIVSPSVEPEAFGRTIIEAMACGIPVVATDVGGPKEIINNNEDGFLVPLSAQQIAEVIGKLLKDKFLCEYISKNALQKVVDEFTIEKQLRQVEQLYDEVICY